MKNTGIIIPCYNESERLDQSKFLAFLKNNSQYYLCFVNDGSSDDTLKTLHHLRAQNSNQIFVLDMKINQGKATAVQNGANYLATMDFIDNIAFLDADLSTSLEELHNLTEKLNADAQLRMVFGSRKAQENENIERNPLRKFLSNLVGFFIQFILQLPIKDTQCGAKVFKKEIVENIYSKRFISRWLFDIEIFLRLKKHIGLQDLILSIREEPLDSWIEVEGSKITLKDSFMIPINLIFIWLNYLQLSREFDEVSDIFALKTNYYMVQ